MPGPLVPEFYYRERPSASKFNDLAEAVAQSIGTFQGPGYAGSIGSYGTPPDLFVLLARVDGNDAVSGNTAHSWTEMQDDLSYPGLPVVKADGVVGTTTILPLYEINGGALRTGRIYYAWRGANEYYLTQENCCLGGTATTSAISSNQNNYVLPLTDEDVAAEFVRVNVDSSMSFTGIVPQYEGQVVTLFNVGDSTAYFEHDSSSSSSANRIFTYTESRLAFPPGASITLVYDDTVDHWVVWTGTSTSYDQTTATATFSTDQDDYDLTTSTGGPAPIQLWDITSDVTITGIEAPASVAPFTVVNTGDSVAYFTHEDGASSANNQFTLPGEVTLAVPPGATATFVKGPNGKWWPSAGTGVSAPGTIALQPTSPPPTPTAGSAIYVDEGDGVLKSKDSAGAVIELGSSSSTSSWTKYTKTYSDLSAASTSTDIELFSLPAKGVILNAIIKTTTTFAGTGITDYDLSVGIVGSPGDEEQVLAVFDADTTASATYFTRNTGNSPVPIIYDFGSATSIRIFASCAGANLDQGTAGSVDIFIEAMTLP